LIDEDWRLQTEAVGRSKSKYLPFGKRLKEEYYQLYLGNICNSAVTKIYVTVQQKLMSGINYVISH